jgi:hypothetical protein
LLAAAFLSSCAVTGPPSRGGPSGADRDLFDIDVTASGEELDAIQFDPDDLLSTVELPVERDRVTARFAFGREAVRGFIHVFKEHLLAEPTTLSVTRVSVDSLGVGGGVKGAPRVNGSEATVAFLIPYRVDVSVVVGDEDTTSAGDDLVMAYLEGQVDLGFGAEWKGLRVSGGATASSLVGHIESDLFEDLDLEGTNVGVYGEVRYKHPAVPVYGRIRATGGDIERTEFALGLAF